MISIYHVERGQSNHRLEHVPNIQPFNWLLLWGGADINYEDVPSGYTTICGYDAGHIYILKLVVSTYVIIFYLIPSV